MPALTVSIDGVTLATVSTEGYDVMSVRADGTRVDENLATLDLSGGSYPESGESTYLTWISDVPLQKIWGQTRFLKIWGHPLADRNQARTPYPPAC